MLDKCLIDYPHNLTDLSYGNRNQILLFAMYLIKICYFTYITHNKQVFNLDI